MFEVSHDQQEFLHFLIEQEQQASSYAVRIVTRFDPAREVDS
jgi:hypothetical protein